MKLNCLLEVLEPLQRVFIVHGEECVAGEVCAMQKLLSKETLSLKVACARVVDSVLKVWVEG